MLVENGAGISCLIQDQGLILMENKCKVKSSSVGSSAVCCQSGEGGAGMLVLEISNDIWHVNCYLTVKAALKRAIAEMLVRGRG